jgi:hypothetical protein
MEIRSKGSYGVLTSPSYERVYGETINWFSSEEIETILEILYGFNENYIHPKPFKGDISDYIAKRRWEESLTDQDVLDIIVSSGSFKEASPTADGELRFVRHGSSSPNSGVIFKDTNIIHVFSPNTIFGESGTYYPLEVYSICNGLTTEEAIEKIKNGEI